MIEHPDAVLVDRADLRFLIDSYRGQAAMTCKVTDELCDRLEMLCLTTSHRCGKIEA